MQLAPPPDAGGLPQEWRNWLTEVYVAFARGLGFPSRFQMGTIFVTTRAGDPATHTDIAKDPSGSTYHRTDGGVGTSFYVKEAASGGWAAK